MSFSGRARRRIIHQTINQWAAVALDEPIGAFKMDKKYQHAHIQNFPPPAIQHKSGRIGWGEKNTRQNCVLNSRLLSKEQKACAYRKNLWLDEFVHLYSRRDARAYVQIKSVGCKFTAFYITWIVWHSWILVRVRGIFTWCAQAEF